MIFEFRHKSLYNLLGVAPGIGGRNPNGSARLTEMTNEKSS